MKQAKLNTEGLAASAGVIHIYHVTQDTGEYIRESDEYISEGVGIPADSYIDEPLPSKRGFSVCRGANGWVYVEDYRGVEAYSIQTREIVQVIALGPLPDGVTTLRPETPFDRWNGEVWVTDEAAKRQAEIDVAARQKRNLEQNANAAIETLNDAIELGLAEPGDEDSLKAWRAYRVKLSRIDVQSAPDIAWPELPAR